MDLVLLGGESPRNKEWLQQVHQALAPLFQQVVVHEHAHWAGAGPSIDLQHELNALRHEVRGLDEYVVFAKSTGALLTIKGIAEKVLRPQACIFVGTPLGFARQHGHQMDVWLRALTVPTLFVQNAHDPTASHQELARYLRQHTSSPTYTLVELPGETHSYTDFEKLTQLVTLFLQKG